MVWGWKIYFNLGESFITKWLQNLLFVPFKIPLGWLIVRIEKSQLKTPGVLNGNLVFPEHVLWIWEILDVSMGSADSPQNFKFCVFVGEINRIKYRKCLCHRNIFTKILYYIKENVMKKYEQFFYVIEIFCIIVS
jgi:hypothetical protein